MSLKPLPNFSLFWLAEFRFNAVWRGLHGKALMVHFDGIALTIYR